MEREDAIKYLENLQQGDFLTVNIPIIADKKIQVTAMYVGKDKEGRYNFYDGGGACGTFKMTAQFIRDKDIKITKQFDEEKTYDIYVKLNEKTQRLKSRER